MKNIQIKEFLLNRIVDQMATFLIEDKNITIIDALNEVYSSNIYNILQSKDGYLVSKSPSYLYELLKKEQISRSNGQKLG